MHLRDNKVKSNIVNNVETLKSKQIFCETVSTKTEISRTVKLKREKSY